MRLRHLIILLCVVVAASWAAATILLHSVSDERTRQENSDSLALEGLGPGGIKAEHAEGSGTAPVAGFAHRHLLDLESLSRGEIERILSDAAGFKEVFTRTVKKLPTLRGKTVVNLFFENSTRTRTSFELAAKRLSADTIDSLARRTPLQRTGAADDVAKAVVYLATAEFVTGQELYVDGGRSVAPLEPRS